MAISLVFIIKIFIISFWQKWAGKEIIPAEDKF